MTTQVTSLEDPQQLEMAVNGPEGVDRLILCTGIVPIAQEADAGTVTQTWTWRVGPALSRAQFRSAIVHGALIRVSQTGGSASWSLMGMHADWDDESGQVEVRAQIQIVAQGIGTSARVEGISYQVSILGALSSEPGKAPTEAGMPVAAPEPLPGIAQPSLGAPQPPPPTEPAETAPAPPPPAEAKTPGPPEGTVLVEKITTPPPPLPLQGAGQQGAAREGASRPTMAGEKVSPPPPPPPVPVAPAHAKAALPPPVLVLAPPVLDFGAVPVGGFRAKTLTITNTGSGGSGPLEIRFSGADASEFSLTVDPASGHILISFQPGSPGPKTTTLQIRTMTGVKAEATIVGTTP